MKRSIALAILIVSILAIFVTCSFLFLNGILRINTPPMSKYPVRGVDLSAYQGKVDWDILSKQGIKFAFIKATEGSHTVDKNFAYNYEQAVKTNLRVGAYHFFSYDSGGDTQADNFIMTVPKRENMLPPVIDVEFYGDKQRQPPDKEDVSRNLTTLIYKLEKYYGLKPVIYTTRKSYKLYISGKYSNYDIWIRDVFFIPTLPDGRQWTFWQFTDKGKIDGYNGTEKYIDLNVFSGSMQEFENYAK